MIPHWPRMIGISCLLLAAAGCANFWDEILSHERDWSYATGIGKPHPMVVLRDKQSDGARRAQALGDLREPLQNGGNAQDQDTYLKILAETATKDHEPLCRLAAIRSLGNYRDPRAARTLEEVYQLPTRKPTSPEDKVLAFTADLNSFIRKEALVALESTKDPEARHLLIRVARQPGPPANADLSDRQQTQDEKIVAIRALRHYRQQEAQDALTHVLKTEKDVALRDRALESLADVTGKRWPAPYEAWQRDDVRPVQGEASLIERVGGLLPK